MCFFSRFLSLSSAGACHTSAQRASAMSSPPSIAAKPAPWEHNRASGCSELGVEWPDVPPSGMQAGCSTLGQGGSQGDTACVALVKRFEGRVLCFFPFFFFMILFCFELLISEYLKLTETHRSFSTGSSGTWLSPPTVSITVNVIKMGRRRQKWRSAKSLKNAEILLASAFPSPVTYSSEHRCN